MDELVFSCYFYGILY